MECAAIAQVLETARRRLLEKQGSYYNHLVKTGQHTSREYWLNSTEDAPIREAVEYAASYHDLQAPEIMRRVHASLRWRVLAGTLTLPLHYDEPDEHAGVCARLELKGGSYDCNVPGQGKQAKADAWHSKFGYGPDCPFWENPNEDDIADPDDQTELEKAMREGLDVKDEESLLKNYRSRGV